MDAGRSFYSELLEAGVRIFELNDAILHSKTAVVDGVWTAIGSSNLDSLSAGFNTEIDVVALGAEPAGEMEAMYEMDLQNATEITRGARGIGQRFRELLGRAVAYWLWPRAWRSRSVSVSGAVRTISRMAMARMRSAQPRVS